jgi:hypothetical protein
MRDLLVELMYGFMDHPMVWVGLGLGVVSLAVRMLIKRFCPIQTGIDAPELLAGPVELHFEARVIGSKPVQRAELT